MSTKSRLTWDHFIHYNTHPCGCFICEKPFKKWANLEKHNRLNHPEAAIQ